MPSSDYDLLEDEPYVRTVARINARQVFLQVADPYQVARYAEKLEAGKQLQPIVLGPMGVVDGNHRYLAAAMVGLEELPAVAPRSLLQ
jgi:ParB-like chromosome segregation protein Spo0J